MRSIPGYPSVARMRLAEVLEAQKIDINHPDLADFKAWVEDENTANNDVAAVNHYLSRLKNHGFICTPRELNNTWRNAEKIYELIKHLSDTLYPDSDPVSIIYERTEANEIICTRNVVGNSPELPYAFIQIIFDYMKTVPFASYKTDEQLSTLAYYIRIVGEYLETQAQAEDEMAIRDEWMPNFLKYCYAQRQAILNQPLDINKAFLSYFAARRANPGADNRLHDFTPTLTPETGAIIPYPPKM